MLFRSDSALLSALEQAQGVSVEVLTVDDNTSDQLPLAEEPSTDVNAADPDSASLAPPETPPASDPTPGLEGKSQA